MDMMMFVGARKQACFSPPTRTEAWQKHGKEMRRSALGNLLSPLDLKPAQPAQVEYIPESQALLIGNGQDSAVGDDFA